MKSTLEQLSGTERQLLAKFYNTETYKALVHFLQLEVNGLAHDALVAQTMEAVKYLHGRSSMAGDLGKLIRELSKESEANKKQKG